MESVNLAGIETKAKMLIEKLGPDVEVQNIKTQMDIDDVEWDRISFRAYEIFIKQAEIQREKDEKNPRILCSSNDEIHSIIVINERLSEYALCIPSTVTLPEIKAVEELLEKMPSTEFDMLRLIEGIVMGPRVRAMQKRGRFERLRIFKEFVRLIDAATICYCRGNYISSCLTLVPVIEGVILRWLGYSGQGKKPGFRQIKKFFPHSHARQLCPSNPLFHRVFTLACEKILTEHLYKPSQRGKAYSNFNRHLASHLLDNDEFATKGNCIRLFLLIDVMTEIYIEEMYLEDPRFKLTEEEIEDDIAIYENLYMQSMNTNTPEKKLLGEV